MDRLTARTLAASAIREAALSVQRAMTLLDSALEFSKSSEMDESLLELLQLHRELVELPRQSGVAPASQDGLYGVDEASVPF